MGNIIKSNLFKGTLNGEISSEVIGNVCYNFMIKLDQNINGVPEEICVRLGARTHQYYFEKGDKVILNGVLIKESFQDEESFLLHTQFAYNKTRKCGDLEVFKL